MNDRAVALVESYGCKVLRSYKGRSAIICETDCGLKILKEYRGPEERVQEADTLLKQMQERGDFLLERFVPTTEGGFLTKDREHNTYILKDYFEGRECEVKEAEDVLSAFRHMAKLHLVMYYEKEKEPPAKTKQEDTSTEGTKDDAPKAGTEKENASEAETEGEDFERSWEYPFGPKESYGYRFLQETEKRNRELKRGKSFLRKKSRRTEFENFLLKEYDHFLQKAKDVEMELNSRNFEEYYRSIQEKGEFCHGDFQYHNVLFVGEKTAVINFEKFRYDSVMKDFSLFFRKVMEKNDWDPELAKRLIDTYETTRPMGKEEKELLVLRLSYPEKFWKIVNFYMNNKKTVVANRNYEKLSNLIVQEEKQKKCISFLETIVYN